MTATIGAARTHEVFVGKLAQAGACAERAAEVSFWDFMRLEEIPAIRPQDHGVREKTAHNYDRSLYQIYSEMAQAKGVDQETAAKLMPSQPRSVLMRLRLASQRVDEHGELVEHVPVPTLPWELEAPDWQTILRWRDTKVKATLETQQKALLWLASYWSQNGEAAPVFLQKEWASEEAKNRARRAGQMEEYDLHLDLPGDLQKIFGARPFEYRLLKSKMKESRQLLRIARYKDGTWRAMCWLLFWTGARISEIPTLTIPMFRPSKGGIYGWPQPKKGLAGRDVVYEEMDAIWTGDTRPTPEWYLTHVRPMAACLNPGLCEDEFWLNSSGEPWTENGVRNFVREGIEIALEGEGKGPHSFRRGLATWLYHNGWAIDEIALLLDDTPKVVDESYINWTWIKRVGRREDPRKRRPPVPLILSDGTSVTCEGLTERLRLVPLSRPSRGVKSAPLGQIAEEKDSAPAGI